MQDLCLSILQLLRETATISVAEDSELLAEATAATLGAMLAEGLIGPKEDWVYQSLMNYMVRSGALIVQSQESSLPPFLN